MNSNPSSPEPAPGGDDARLNAAILQRLKSYRWKSRVLTVVALTTGLLSIVVGIALASFMSRGLFPNVQLLLESTSAARQTGTNSVAPPGTNSVSINMLDGRTITASDPEWRHVVVTLMLGKGMFLSSVSIALLGAGTLLTLVLVIFHRHVTLRQVNESLAAISSQIKELQDGKNADPGK